VGVKMNVNPYPSGLKSTGDPKPEPKLSSLVGGVPLPDVPHCHTAATRQRGVQVLHRLRARREPQRQMFWSPRIVPGGKDRQAGDHDQS
jgi:hypothetical protein